MCQTMSNKHLTMTRNVELKDRTRYEVPVGVITRQVEERKGQKMRSKVGIIVIGRGMEENRSPLTLTLLYCHRNSFIVSC